MMVKKCVVKKIFIFSIVFILLIPFCVNANIICNDGTESPTCQDCHTGCCSDHDGCTENPNHYNNYDGNGNSYIYKNNNEIKDKKLKEMYLEISIIVFSGTIIVYLCALLLKKGSDIK